VNGGKVKRKYRRDAINMINRRTIVYDFFMVFLRIAYYYVR